MNQMARIASEVCERRGLPVTVVSSRRKTPKAVDARHEVFWRCYQLRGPQRDDPYSYPAIGRYFDYDHTSVMAGVKRYERLFVNDAG